MSVEISGPKGYDYQYLSSLLIALEYLDKDDVEVYIEKKNEEDSQVIFNEDGRKYIIDIQVKSRSEDIKLEDFSCWISHFESRSSNENLLNKIEKNELRFAIFISDSRCGDDVSLFIGDGILHSVLSNGLSNNLLNKIKNHIYDCYSDTKLDLSVLRKAYLKEYLDNISISDFRNILKRIKIIEKNTEKYATEKIRYFLNTKYYIPQGIIDRVISELMDKIRNGRDIDNSISSDLICIIDKYSGKNILNKDQQYIGRDEKKLCEDILKNENILLLTGVSFCGKTYLAKDIAQGYLENGYRVEITGEIYGDNGAISYIKHRGIENRLLILEDPFGQVETKKDVDIIKNEIRNLSRESKSNRKIIITSRRDILLDTMSKKYISLCSIDSHNWIELTLGLSNKILILWKKYFGDSVESTVLYDKVTDWILKTEKSYSLQLGHVANIYNSKASLAELGTLEPVEIVNIARIDSNDLANIIERRGSIASKFFIALGLSCNTYKFVNLKDLVFILSDCKEQPSINEDHDTCIEYSFNEVAEESFPRYQLALTITEEYKSELRYLRQHGYIEIDNLKRIMFVHPIYHYATQLLFEKQFIDIFEEEEVLNIAKRSLSSLSNNANLCTLIMIENVYNKNSSDELKELMLRSLKSIFPNVRDRVIMFFDRRINDLDESEQKKIVSVLKYGDNIENNGILWYEGMPWFNPSKSRGLSYHDWLCDKISKEEVDSLLEKIDGKITLSSEEMWTLISMRNDKLITFKILEKALSYDESFIRARAIRLIFKDYAFQFDKVDVYLDIYEHPDVIFSLFRGSLDSWSKYNDQIKKLITEYYKKSLELMSVSIRSKRFLENFEDEYSSESIDWSEVGEVDKKKLWSVWYEVFIEFLNKFPSRYIKMHEPHMVRVTEDSLKYINSEEKVVELAIAWFNWLNRYLQYNTPDDYGMSVAQFLIDGTLNNSICRESIFKLMLLTDKTSFITSNVKVFIDSWEYLSDNEKKLVLELLTSRRKDVKWIQAVALNRSNLSSEIEIELLGKSIDGKDINDIVDMLVEKDILEQCLNVYCGYPQPLWWNGYHHNNYKLWDAVIVEVLKRNELNRIFDIALKEVIDLLYNDNTSRITNIYNVYIDNLLKVKEKRKLVFDRLLHETIDQNQSNKKVWNLLIEHSSEEEKEIYYQKIAENIELVQQYQINDGDLFALFNKEMIFNKIYPRIKNDYKIVAFCNNNDLRRMFVSSKSDRKLLDKFKNMIEETIIKFYLKEPPRMSLTNKFVKKTIERFDIKSPEIVELIENTRVRLIELPYKLTEVFDDNYDIENWIE